MGNGQLSAASLIICRQRRAADGRPSPTWPRASTRRRASVPAQSPTRGRACARPPGHPPGPSAREHEHQPGHTLSVRAPRPRAGSVTHARAQARPPARPPAPAPPPPPAQPPRRKPRGSGRRRCGAGGAGSCRVRPARPGRPPPSRPLPPSRPAAAPSLARLGWRSPAPGRRCGQGGSAAEAGSGWAGRAALHCRPPPLPPPHNPPPRPRPSGLGWRSASAQRRGCGAGGVEAGRGWKRQGQAGQCGPAAPPCRLRPLHRSCCSGSRAAASGATLSVANAAQLPPRHVAGAAVPASAGVVHRDGGSDCGDANASSPARSPALTGRCAAQRAACWPAQVHQRMTQGPGRRARVRAYGTARSGRWRVAAAACRVQARRAAGN